MIRIVIELIRIMATVPPDMVLQALVLAGAWRGV
jgi:hypothetical protein